jgi:RNA polymerase sigma-70 factor (ECF subfamily)
VSPPLPSSDQPTGPESSSGFGSFYQVTLSPLRRYLATILGSSHEAQDIAHDAYMKTYRAMHEHPVEKPSAFLFTTARRLALNYRMRRGDRMQPTEAADLEAKSPAAPDAAELAATREKADALAEAILALPSGCREVLMLRNLEELSHDQIAERLGISRSGVEKQLSRALRLLRAQIRNSPE